MSFTKRELARAKKIARKADREGTIHPLEMADLFPGRPELHTETPVIRAWRLALGDDIDVAELSERLWG
jgi:hypothetical protein